VRPCRCAEQLIELDLNRFGVAVLGVLNEEDHQECDDGRSGIDDELPGIAVLKERAGHQPGQYHNHRPCEGQGTAG
jgi:hypothetical protein